ncbi:MAG: hypothetical protein VX225_02350, partial [Pseudomonadota bacterium]|nr:hypothetical protein [Pseudomonadota bacterium]
MQWISSLSEINGANIYVIIVLLISLVRFPLGIVSRFKKETTKLPIARGITLLIALFYLDSFQYYAQSMPSYPFYLTGRAEWNFFINVLEAIFTVASVSTWNFFAIHSDPTRILWMIGIGVLAFFGAGVNEGSSGKKDERTKSGYAKDKEPTAGDTDALMWWFNILLMS